MQGVAVKMLAAGAEHTTAVTENGKLYGWGWGRYGNLGLGDREDRLVPAEVAAIAVWTQNSFPHMLHVSSQMVPRWVTPCMYLLWVMILFFLCKQGELMNMVACGWRHTIAVGKSGNIYSFGWSKYGQLGHGDFADHLVPHQVQFLKHKKIQAVRLGAYYIVSSEPFHEILLFCPHS